jgi:hypothetical protein
MSEHQLITPRRNFLIRALGFTAAGATVSIPIITPANAKERIDLHAKQLEKAWGDYYAGLNVSMQGNDALPEHVMQGGGACLIFYATARKD